MSDLETLKSKALDNPFSFSLVDARKLRDHILKDKKKMLHIREMILRVYDINDRILLELSDATKGFLGKQNKKSTDKRIKEYYRRIKGGLRKDPKGKVILAEGDSWFQFPLLIDDIIDSLNNYDTNAIYSIAYGGDWITNIIYQEDYVSELSVHDPDIFLVSGGGNDLVGGNRLATMVDRRPQPLKYTSIDQLMALTDLSDTERRYIIEAQPFIRKEFYAFINTLMVMYLSIFQSIINSGKYNAMLILTHGYDAPFPRWKSTNLFNLGHFIEQRLVKSGRWLKRPLSIKGIPEDKHRATLVSMIFEVNQMFKSVAKEFENVYHIDCRGVAPNQKDWVDELHLTSKNFKKIGAVYQKFVDGSIRNHQNWSQISQTKVARVTEII
ncbi:MAG: hypothetical protein RIE86_02915 [Imperialibacter sp.]|uniref:hypothetical protein n=1 Tax=Imperialibacter sp. TaxID=2038411 RepID=UPI0032ECAFD7